MMLDEIRKVLEKEKKVLFAYLFGSSARNEKYSKDVDIAIVIKGKVPLNYESKLALKIERVTSKPVEVIVLNDRPLLFISEVLRQGKLIFSRNEKERVRFETFMLSNILAFNELMKEFDRMRFKRYGIG